MGEGHWHASGLFASKPVGIVDGLAKSRTAAIASPLLRYAKRSSGAYQQTDGVGPSGAIKTLGYSRPRRAFSHRVLRQLRTHYEKISANQSPTDTNRESGNVQPRGRSEWDGGGRPVAGVAPHGITPFSNFHRPCETIRLTPAEFGVQVEPPGTVA